VKTVLLFPDAEELPLIVADPALGEALHAAEPVPVTATLVADARPPPVMATLPDAAPAAEGLNRT